MVIKVGLKTGKRNRDATSEEREKKLLAYLTRSCALDRKHHLSVKRVQNVNPKSDINTCINFHLPKLLKCPIVLG